MAGAGRQADEQGRAVDPARRGLVGGGETALDGIRHEVLAGDGEPAVRPRLTDELEGRHEPVVDDVLEGAEREAVVEDGRRRRGVEPLGRPYERLGVLGLVAAAGAQGRDAAGPALAVTAAEGGLAAGGVAAGEPTRRLGSGLAGRPALVDEGVHDREGADVLGTVEAVAAVGALRADDAVAALPRAEGGDADPGQLGGTLDGVHRLPQPAQRVAHPLFGLVAEPLEGRREQRGDELRPALELEVRPVGDGRALTGVAPDPVTVRTKVMVSFATTVAFSPRSANRSPGTRSMTR